MTSQEIKSLELNEKIEYFRNIFSNLNNENEFDILNIFRLVNSYNTFDDDFFDHEGSYITDIAEFIDIKMALEEEINNFSVELIKWYFSLLYSCDIKTDNSVSSIEIAASSAISKLTIKSIILNSPTSFFPIIR